MEIDSNIINCPNCGEPINVSDLLFHQVQEQLSKEYEEKSAKKDNELKKIRLELQAEQERLDLDKENIQQQIDTEVRTKLIAQKSLLEKSIRTNIVEETAEQIQNLQKELEEKSVQVKEYNKAKAEIEKLKREKDELRDVVAYEKEIEFSEKLKEEKTKIKKQVDEASAMKIKELEKQLEDQKNLAEEMKRKAEQGSTQLQGEVQELAIEEILISIFPFDLIAEVGKGIKGADVVHTVLAPQ